MFGVFWAVFLATASVTLVSAQEPKVPPHPTRNTPGPVTGGSPAPPQAAQRKQFALNVLQSAVALPQNDPQDRLRVLVSAARLANSLSPRWKKTLVHEGNELESRLIASGQQPRVSMVQEGFVDSSLECPWCKKGL